MKTYLCSYSRILPLIYDNPFSFFVGKHVDSFTALSMFFFESALIKGVLKRYCVPNKQRNGTYATIISLFFLTMRLKYKRLLRAISIPHDFIELGEILGTYCYLFTQPNIQ